MSAECSICGNELNSTNAHGKVTVGRYRCGTCGATVCLDCNLFDVDGKRACVACYRSGRATVPGVSRQFGGERP
jgi:hypothetical protein